MKLVFMGTPDFSVGTLEKLIEAGHEVFIVTVNPDDKSFKHEQENIIKNKTISK